MRKPTFFVAAACVLLPWLTRSAIGQSIDAAPTGFESIFNGSDLTDWRGRDGLWRVEEGTITGQSTADQPLDSNTFLVYQQDVPEDFELLLQYRIVGGNSGIQYRSELVDEKKFIVKGYQADIDSGPTFSGIHYEERDRGILAQRGQSATVLSDGTKQATTIAKSEDLQTKIRKEDWNQYRIVVQGNRTQHFINDALMSECIDQERSNRDGILAFQLHAGPPMRVQFRNIYLKDLTGSSASTAIAFDGSPFTQHVAKLIANQQIPGSVAAVWQDGNEVFVDIQGDADIQSKKPVERSTLFRIASMTKPITSVAAMRLIDQKKLSLDDPVSKFIPAFASMVVALEGGKTEPAMTPITIRHLLTHTSGLSYRMNPRPLVDKAYDDNEVQDGLAPATGTQLENCQRIAKCPLLFHPGTAWEYGLNTDVLGAVLEQVEGTTLDKILQDQVFAPLGMKETYFTVPEPQRQRLASLYELTTDGELKQVDESLRVEGQMRWSDHVPLRDDNQCFSGGAGLVSTLDDYYTFCKMLLDEGQVDGKAYLSLEAVKAMRSNQIGETPIWIDWHGDKFGFGFGVVTSPPSEPKDPSEGVYSWAGAFATSFFIDPKNKTIAIRMMQLMPAGDTKLRETFEATVHQQIHKASSN
jgi:CubicO group peptidase (beta-lactamase class C family)